MPLENAHVRLHLLSLWLRWAGMIRLEGKLAARDRVMQHPRLVRMCWHPEVQLTSWLPTWLLCSRCTGYRPILDAFKTFAKTEPRAYTEEAIAASKGLAPAADGSLPANGFHANGNGVANGGANGICPSSGLPCDCKAAGGGCGAAGCGPSGCKKGEGQAMGGKSCVRCTQPGMVGAW